ncbi:aldolase [Gloeophyllum trabeum ATCC 11539]|uniref:hydroxymethylglutaryl-CoA lyase n=1 Tax=Gloeophyllum trabeum (strain ATCC 11539 / FP-39264 / Madison 617) TaxID=670483 RepID=S7PX72_GLOTA|nr:aldolase [Gloeophyllum trabeum ATCC 11539]EPQ51962.1 aldolase [Gloeophyllum trabeum ATCC 11539]
MSVSLSVARKRIPHPLRSCLATNPSLRACTSRTYRTESKRDPNVVRIVEVGPRDGLQNEKGVVPAEVKVELINRLGRAGMRIIEAGSFVSPKWVPQMAGTAEVITRMEKLPGVHYPVLVPNMKGLENLLELLSATTAHSVGSLTSTIPPTDEIAIFTAATDAFSLANTNCTVAESLTRLAAVTQKAREKGLRVRGYVSVVITCPYSGKVDYRRVRDVSRELLEMGCYEVSLGDTTGVGNPASVGAMLDVVAGALPVERLAGHFHDTYGMGVANALTALEAGIRTLDSSVGGLGGCPYSPGATGNVATEDILYSIQDSKYRTEKSVDLEAIADIGWWISEKLNRQNASRVGRALRARKERQKKQS